MSEPLRAISLFSGAGGMDVGFENAGIKVVFANELVSDAAETYKANHPDCIMVNDDINNVIDSLDKYEGIDLVFGGPPCQGFSVAGKMNPDDDRSKLVFTFLDVIEKFARERLLWRMLRLWVCWKSGNLCADGIWRGLVLWAITVYHLF